MSDSASGALTDGLHEVVVNDDQRYIGVPMLLHTPSSLGPAPDPAQFSTAGYLRQAELGRRLLETGSVSAEEAGGAHVLSLNFHAVPRECQPAATERIRRVLELGRPFDPDADTDGPRVLIAFFDGDRDTGQFADEICSRLGVRAYFFPLLFTDLEFGPRLTDADLADIAQRHELCFHTSNHRSADEITPANAEAEVTAAVQRIVRAAGHPPRVAAWCGGDRFDPDHLGNRMLPGLGLRHLVSNWAIEPLPGAAVGPPRSSRS